MLIRIHDKGLWKQYAKTLEERKIVELICPFISCYLNRHAGGKFWGWVQSAPKQQIPTTGDDVDFSLLIGLPVSSFLHPCSSGPCDDKTGEIHFVPVLSCSFSRSGGEPDIKVTHDLLLSFISHVAVCWSLPFNKVWPSYLIFSPALWNCVS